MHKLVQREHQNSGTSHLRGETDEVPGEGISFQGHFSCP